MSKTPKKPESELGVSLSGTPEKGQRIIRTSLRHADDFSDMAVAGFAGLLIPIALDKLGVDPALASGAFVTTVTDVVGFLSFLGLAALVLI